MNSFQTSQSFEIENPKSKLLKSEFAGSSRFWQMPKKYVVTAAFFRLNYLSHVSSNLSRHKLTGCSENLYYAIWLGNYIFCG